MPELKSLTLEDKFIVEKYLKIKKHQLSPFAFANIYIWKCLFEIYWTIIDECFCLFAEDKNGCFMYLPPLGEKISGSVIEQCFEIMDSENENKNVTRIENVEEDSLSLYQLLGCKIVPKGNEYFYQREDLVNLKGNKLKAKRLAYNYFVKHYQYNYQPFEPPMKDECLSLLEKWKKNRQEKYTDVVYQAMLEDSFSCQKITLENCAPLDLLGRVVKIENRIKGYTFGFEINEDIFCILFEITDLKIKGLAQFIFRKFCREMKMYKNINLMDDSGLENLRRVKLSYYPSKQIRSYIVYNALSTK
ncbi:MAG: phosphatidylglycerol lysyltransferase domain-containing protein [Candidatus Edwardsbacteria bacterium]